MLQPSASRSVIILESKIVTLTVTVKVILGDLTSTGSGSSKKQAKHAAARAMLDKLDGRVPAQDGQTPLPPVADTANGPQAPGKEHHHQVLHITGIPVAGNTVGALQELCVKHGYPMPTYDLGSGITHNLIFICYIFHTFLENLLDFTN